MGLPTARATAATNFIRATSDAEWAHIEPLIPSGKPGGGKRRVAIREVINGVPCALHPRILACERSARGCQWRRAAKDLPPRSTVHDYLGLWKVWVLCAARWISIMRSIKCREKAAREASHRPECEKRHEKGGLAGDSHGFDAGKLIMFCDTQGLLLHGIVTAADVRSPRSRAAGDACRPVWPSFKCLGRNCSPTAPIRPAGLSPTPWPGIEFPISRPRSSSAAIG